MMRQLAHIKKGQLLMRLSLFLFVKGDGIGIKKSMLKSCDLFSVLILVVICANL